MSVERTPTIPFIGVAIACLGVAAWAVSDNTPRPADAVPEQSFTFIQEFYGSEGYKDPQARLNLAQGMMNGLTLWPPLEPGAARLAEGAGSVSLRLAGGDGVAGHTPEDIERYLSTFTLLAKTAPGVQLFWDLMPEWDQSGGDWVPQGRPSYTGLSRREAYGRFLAHYEGTHPSLMARLRRAGPRDYQLAAITDHSPNVAYAYELGAELQLLERGIDELGDLSTGIAYLRGAARQFGRRWGIDISTWRSSTNGATAYDSAGRLKSGWSANYLERIYYLAFAAGAQVIHNEAATYRNANGTLNPFGRVTQKFADFSLRRHPDLGKPSVNVAVLMDHYAGFDPKHGVHNQASAVWYQDLPYSDGDFMLDNFMQAAYPDHSQHGLAPGAPFADSGGVPESQAFARFLSQGGDARPFEPMPTTRWGDNIDFITTQASPETLSRYKAILLAGELNIDEALLRSLETWVKNGGVLILNAAQTPETNERLAGVRIASRTPKRASGWRWISSFFVQPEQEFFYLAVEPGDAKVLAISPTGDPLITSRGFGSGEVILTTPLFLQSAARDRFLDIGTALMDRLIRRFEPVEISGGPIEYVIGRPADKVVITLANHASTAWNGRIVAPITGTAVAVDYLSDETLQPVASSGKQITLGLEVPSFGVRVVAITQPR